MEHRDDESSAPPGLLYRLCVSYSLATASLRSIASINGHSHRVVFTLHAKENEANQKIILGKQISLRLQKVRITVAKEKHQI